MEESLRTATLCLSGGTATTLLLKLAITATDTQHAAIPIQSNRIQSSITSSINPKLTPSIVQPTSNHSYSGKTLAARKSGHNHSASARPGSSKPWGHETWNCKLSLPASRTTQNIKRGMVWIQDSPHELDSQPTSRNPFHPLPLHH